jgi:DNA-binding transcriptional LysR family regulator
MPDALNWDEFRIVKAIAETQSLGGAAERLGLNHSTMFRRLTALETRLGMRLFERERSGYRPTAAGEDMIALATLMGDTIAEFERRVSSNDVRLSGHVRLTTLNPIGVLMLPPILAALMAAYPGLHVDLVLTESPPDLFLGEADVALRCLRGPPSDSLFGRRIAPSQWAVYAAPALMTDTGERKPEAPWVVPGEGFGPLEARRWLDRHVEPWRRAATSSDLLVMADLAARGAGVALLPCFVGCAKPQLRRVGATVPELDGALWLVAKPQALRTPRVRALFEFVADELERRRPWFEGEAVIGA